MAPSVRTGAPFSGSSATDPASIRNRKRAELASIECSIFPVLPSCFLSFVHFHRLAVTNTRIPAAATPRQNGKWMSSRLQMRPIDQGSPISGRSRASMTCVKDRFHDAVSQQRGKRKGAYAPVLLLLRHKQLPAQSFAIAARRTETVQPSMRQTMFCNSPPLASRLTLSAIACRRRAMVPRVHPDMCGVMVRFGSVSKARVAGRGASLAAEG